MLPNEYSNDYIGRKGSSAANAAETSRFRLRPSGYAETGRSMKHTGKPVMKSARWAYESAAGPHMNYRLSAVRKRHGVPHAQFPMRAE